MKRPSRAGSKAVRLWNKAYYATHREESKQRATAWIANNRSKFNARLKKSRAKDPTHRREVERRCRERLRLEVISAMGARCTCCGETRTRFLTIDHVAEDGSAHRQTYTAGGGAGWREARRLGYPDSLQLLCQNCNMSKYFGGGLCVHHRPGQDRPGHTSSQRYKRKLRKEALHVLGGRCVCCGEFEQEFLAIDHVAEDGATQRRTESRGSLYRRIRDVGQSSDLPDLQILCHNCNWSKHCEGICVHVNDDLSGPR